MRITDDDLKNAYKSQIRRHAALSRERCPSAESIFSVFDDSVSLVDKEKVIDHVTSCSRCLQEFELLLDLCRQEEKAVDHVVSFIRARDQSAGSTGKKPKIPEKLLGQSFQTRPLWQWAAGFLFAVIITGLFLIVVKPIFRTPKDRERGRLPGYVHLISPVRGEVIGFPLVFRWGAISNAEYYQLEIFDESLLPLWKSPRIEEAIYKLTEEAAKIIQKNTAYFWTITAWLSDGTKRESPLEGFTFKE